MRPLRRVAAGGEPAARVGERVWRFALLSGAIFLGGLAMLRLLRRRPAVRRVVPSERGLTTLLRPRARRWAGR